MTTIAAIVCPQLKLAVIGADGQVTTGERVAKLTAKKFSVANNIGFAFAGSAMAGKAAERLFNELIGETSDPLDVLQRFQRRIEKFDDPVLAKGALGIVAWPEGLYQVATVDCPMKVERSVNNLLFATSGSGGDYALGALHAMAQNFDFLLARGASAKLVDMLTAAINIGIFYDRNSGGIPVVEVLDGNPKEQPVG